MLVEIEIEIIDDQHPTHLVIWLRGSLRPLTISKEVAQCLYARLIYEHACHLAAETPAAVTQIRNETGEHMDGEIRTGVGREGRCGND
jgi:hypothetical protein